MTAGKESKAKTFDILHFVADNAGLSTFEAIEKAYNMGVSNQEPITWIVGKDNCQVAVRNMPIDKIQKICAIIEAEELAESEDKKWLQ